MKDRKAPVRMCIACRKGKPKEELIRIVRDQDGAFRVDVTGKRPGRGAYICAEDQCIDRAQKIFKKVMRCEMDGHTYAELKEIADDRRGKQP